MTWKSVGGWCFDVAQAVVTDVVSLIFIILVFIFRDDQYRNFRPDLLSDAEYAKWIQGQLISTNLLAMNSMQICNSVT